MGSSAPAPPNFTGAAQQQADQQNALVDKQTQQNRINQYNPYASLTYGPDGSQQFAFNGAMGGLNQSLQQQAAQAMGTPFSLSGLPQAPDAGGAREQAINAAYGSATSRLDPMFQQREADTRTRLMNQGLQPGSEAYEREMGQLGRDRSDAYNQALSGAIGQGTAAGSALFQQGMQSRQQALEEMLRQRGQAFGELGQMNGLMGMQGYNQAGLGQGANLLGAAGLQENANFGRWQTQQQMLADIIGSGTQLAGTLGAAFASDERAKDEIQRLGYEVLPGVEAVSFRYKPEMGLGTKRHIGVLAQDVEKAMPGVVSRRSDGLLMVPAALKPIPVEE